MECFETESVHEHGHKLINLCKMCDLLIMNGRAGEDKGVGKFTFCNTRGKSVNDYLICSKGVLENVSNFSVSDMHVFSDHAKICLSLKCNMTRCDYVNENISSNTVKMKWKGHRKEEYIENLIIMELSQKIPSV